MSEGLTQTKKRMLLKSMAGFEGIVNFRHIEQLSSRHHSTPQKIRDLLVANGFTCEVIAPAVPKPIVQTKIEKIECPLTPQEINLIKYARIYKELGNSVICINGSLFHRERQAILKLLEAFK